MSAHSSRSTGLRRYGMTLINGMERSLSSKEFSDVQFTVGQDFGPPKLFQAHKYVLCLRSSVFCTMFYGSLPEKGEEPIDIPDVVPNAFENMLRYLYTDTVYLGVGDVCQTFMCADKYDVPLLMEKCCQFVSAHLSTLNCLTLLKHGVEFHAEEIVESCLDFIDKNADEVVPEDDFTVIGQELLVLMLQRDTLLTEEHNIYSAVERWALKACDSHNLDASVANRRQILGEALFLVRFPLLSNTQLADGPVKSGLLLESEIRDLYQYKFATVKPPLPFSTEPRHARWHRIGDDIFLHEEKVFVKAGYFLRKITWAPAEIIGIERAQFEWRSVTHSEGGPCGLAEIVRASDILKPGQELLAGVHGDNNRVVYRRASGKYHMVYRKGEEFGMEFGQLGFNDAQMNKFLSTRR
ncbi:BTB/POZ domain-containing protein 1-like [Paramacrobiotus metropolitanus]|uniref:BTB/POZ domain-containing protein 1-like n=1 Tax=Paramacrobiotus metropolitanus TaxID=2943436 RepID=UPI00244615C6|nr:BTB/POZ domain-containing protein 1-like [Paramacrobiotus metropolitanus]